MALNRFAMLADIHGNRWALEAVLADLQKRGITEIVNLGDHLYGPLDPSGTAEILMSQNFHNVKGNGDRVLVSPPEDYASNNSIVHCLNSLDDSHIKWLGSHPFSTVLDDDIYLCHASPNRDDEYMLLDISAGGMVLRNSRDTASMLPDINATLFLCGHDHTPQTLMLDNGSTIHNPGSVGLQAYDDDLPFPHVIENGSPHARYSIISKSDKSWKIEKVELPYDWDSAVKEALKNGNESWAVWLQTGRV